MRIIAHTHIFANTAELAHHTCVYTTGHPDREIQQERDKCEKSLICVFITTNYAVAA